MHGPTSRGFNGVSKVVCIILLVATFVAAPVYAERSREQEEDNKIGSAFNGMNVANNLPSQYSLGASKHLSKSTLAAIIDNDAKKWLLRVDNPHNGANFPHVNINGFLTKVRDPHMRISPAVANILGASHTVAKKAGEWLPVVSTAINVVRLGSAVYEDTQSNEKGMKNTGKTATVMVGEVSGGYAGSSAGVSIGSWVGFAIGNVPGAAIGSLVGGVVGGIFGANQGNNVANWLWP